MMKFSIIIVNYRSWKPLRKCLDSIINQGVNSEIIVIDNENNINENKKIKNEYDSVKLLSNKENVGFSKACNQGAKISKNEWILFLNPDTILPKNCLIKLSKKIVNNKNDIIGIKQVDENSIDNHAYGIFLNIFTFSGAIRFFYRLVTNQTKKNNSKKREFRPDWISGSFLLISRFNFFRIGGWDENFWMYYEDMDLCKRASKIGIKTMFYNDIHCIHYHGLSSRIDFETKVTCKSQVIISSFLYINKHFSNLYKFFLIYVMKLSIYLELILLCPFSKTKRSILKKLYINR